MTTSEQTAGIGNVRTPDTGSGNTGSGNTGSANSGSGNTGSANSGSAESGSHVDAVVSTVDELDVGAMKMAKVGERRVVVIRTTSGFHVLDNACPHQGYGLATGSLDGELITCQWHNWKFRVSDGSCVIGQENVACHQVRVEGNDVIVSVTERSADQRLKALWPSLLRGIERDYRGQIARDTARLLDAGATPESILAVGIRHGLPRTEWGLGHDMAVAADLLTLSDKYDGIEKTLPLTHALTGFSEQNRDRPKHDVPAVAEAPADQAVFIDAIEQEDDSRAVNCVRSLLAATNQAEAVDNARRWFIDAISRHHYDYGHGAIYTQKAFELIERIPEVTELVLTELALTLVYGTREDTLPYMRTANRAINAIDLCALAATHGPQDADHSLATDDMAKQILDADQVPISGLVDAALHGGGVIQLMDAVSRAASERMLRYDLAIERDRTEDFSWLDITHALTYANAARWAWRNDPGPAAARLVLLTCFLAFDSGRAERRRELHEASLPAPAKGDIVQAVLDQRVNDAMAYVGATPHADAADQLEVAALEDTAGSFIVMAHLVKTAVAARDEANATGQTWPLLATARFMASARAERFVTVGAREAIAFVRSGTPPVR